MHYHCNQNRQSIGVSSDSLHTTAALLQIHSNKQCLFLLPASAHSWWEKNKSQSLKRGEGNSIWCRLITIKETVPVKQMQPHLKGGEKKKKKTFKGSDIWEQFKVSKLISTSHFKVCKNNFLYQHTGCISSAFLLFDIFFADWDTWILGLNGSL